MSFKPEYLTAQSSRRKNILHCVWKEHECVTMTDYLSLSDTQLRNICINLTLTDHICLFSGCAE